MGGLGSLLLFWSGWRAWGDESKSLHAAPENKQLSDSWVRSLFERGQPDVYSGKELAYIGMPIGGICAGHLHLGGDGKLWHWDIFNVIYNSGCSGERYLKPPLPSSPLEQGFALEIAGNGGKEEFVLDKTGFPDIRFRGEYPIGRVEYRRKGSPVAVDLEAFSPFIPLDEENSATPATLLNYTVRNLSDRPLSVTLKGWLQNAVGIGLTQPAQCRRNRIVAGEGFTFLECYAEHPDLSASQPDVVVEDWSRDGYAGWKVEGDAFGNGPIRRCDLPAYIGGGTSETDRIVQSHATAPGSSMAGKDAATGKLSREFLLERDYLHFAVSGGNHPAKTCVNLLVDGKVVRSVTGRSSHVWAKQVWDLKPWKGANATLEIVDAESGGWGNIAVGKIVLSDHFENWSELEARHDFGTMGLALYGAPAEIAEAKASSLPGKAVSTHSGGEALVGALGRKLEIPAGGEATVTFAVTWHFPNLVIDPKMVGRGRWYSKLYDSAKAVASRLAERMEALSSQTRLWRDTWYDSSLPYWLLDRTFLNTGILATSTAYRLSSGRFYGWEGVGSCAGTCTHVWHYAHAPARLFPALERAAREMNDFNPAVGLMDRGAIAFRGEFTRTPAMDGQAGCILRAYREHQMSADDQFLRRIWPRLKQSIQYLMSRDRDGDGLLDGGQHNTLDTDWYGEIAWLSGLYAAALLAGEAMALEMGDDGFADECRVASERTRAKLPSLFEGDYFINRVDPAHIDAINSGTGCEIDQVFGQSWAFQVGLPRVFSREQAVAALRALWKYNFVPDAGEYRKHNKPGRWYAAQGEAGLLMCSFPRSDWDYKRATGKGPEWAAGYFNECMNGFEYQVASHMIWEGLVQEGLAVTRAVHDRYHPSKRNPWMEIECGDYYARSMASYGVFLALCGYEYHGPKGTLGFAPKVRPEAFKAAFTTAEGWGSYSQQYRGNSLSAQLALGWGVLKLKQLTLERPANAHPGSITISAGGRPIAAEAFHDKRRTRLVFGETVLLKAGETLKVELS